MVFAAIYFFNLLVRCKAITVNCILDSCFHNLNRSEDQTSAAKGSQSSTAILHLDEKWKPCEFQSTNLLLIHSYSRTAGSQGEEFINYALSCHPCHHFEYHIVMVQKLAALSKTKLSIKKYETPSCQVSYQFHLMSGHEHFSIHCGKCQDGCSPSEILNPFFQGLEISPLMKILDLNTLFDDHPRIPVGLASLSMSYI